MKNLNTIYLQFNNWKESNIPISRKDIDTIIGKFKSVEVYEGKDYFTVTFTRNTKFRVFNTIKLRKADI